MPMELSERPPTIYDLLMRFLELLGTGIVALTNRVVLAIAVVSLPWAFIAYALLLPEEKRGEIEGFGQVVEALSSVALGPVLGFGGWALLALVLLVGVPAFFLQHQRLRAQGEENARLRKLEDEGRLTTRDRDALLSHLEKSSVEHNVATNTQNPQHNVEAVEGGSS